MNSPDDILPHSPLARFERSLRVDHEKWHDGVGYDLDAIREAAPDELASMEALLLERDVRDWRDVEALAAVGRAVVPHPEQRIVVEPEGLEETVEGYQGIGTQMGGVSVQIDEITVNGDEAEIKYTLLFGGNPTYSDLTGSAVRTDAGWQISRDMFCGLMTSARVGCPDQ